MFNNKSFLVLSSLILVAGLTANANSSNGKVTLDVMMDGQIVRCEEGGDTLGNQIGYSFGEATVRYNSSSDKVTVLLKTVYKRCELVNGTATVVGPINPFSPYTYKVPYINQKGEKAVNKVTKQFSAIQIVASKHDSYSYAAKSGVASAQSYNALSKSVNFEIVIDVKNFLSRSEIADLNSGKDASIKAVLTSTGQDSGEKEFLAGGSYVLSFDITKARNAKENVSNLKLQRAY
jgi:hypothetical protein